MKQTSEEWHKTSKYSCVRIMDPDGWDRSDFYFSWYVEVITEKEFQKRLSMSTCHIPRQNLIHTFDLI